MAHWGTGGKETKRQATLREGIICYPSDILRPNGLCFPLPSFWPRALVPLFFGHKLFTRHIEQAACQVLKPAHRPYRLRPRHRLSGGAWTFVALDPDTKLVPAYHVGKRSRPPAVAFRTKPT